MSFSIKRIIHAREWIRILSSSWYLTSECMERVNYRDEHEKIKVRIHKQTCNNLFILFIDIDEIPGQRFLAFY